MTEKKIENVTDCCSSQITTQREREKTSLLRKQWNEIWSPLLKWCQRFVMLRTANNGMKYTKVKKTVHINSRDKLFLSLQPRQALS